MPRPVLCDIKRGIESSGIPRSSESRLGKGGVAARRGQRDLTVQNDAGPA
jgi:hypothetical protein